MSRGLTSTIKSAAAAATIYPAFLVEMDFSGGAVRVWTGMGSISWNGYTWLGVGDLGGISPISETSEVRANGISLTLSGVDSARVTDVLSEDYRGRSCKVWLALLDSAGTVLADPDLRFSGVMDQASIEDNGETCTITMAAESRLVDLQRSRERRLTDEDQQNLFPGDRGLEFVAAMQDKELLWGVTGSGTATGGSNYKAAVYDDFGPGLGGNSTPGGGVNFLE